MNVISEGARGDGSTNDTPAIQRASDKVRAAGGGTVVFPSGVYLLYDSVHIYPGISYVGTGASVIRAKSNYPKDTRLFTTESFPWIGLGDSPLLVVRGLIFDGQSSQQGAYKNYENEHAHLLYLSGSPWLPGRLRALVESSTFRNGVADGLSIAANTDVQVRNVRAENSFRGGVVVTGGNTKVDVDGLTTIGDVDRTGIDVETDLPGYGGSLKNETVWKNLDLDADLDFGLLGGSTVYAENITMHSGPIFLMARDSSSIRIVNSTLAVGMADSYLNRIVAPGSVSFENTTFVMTQQGYGDYYGIDIYWQLFPTTSQQSVSCNGCRFTTDGTVRAGVPVYGFVSRSKSGNDSLTVTNSSFTSRFTAGIRYIAG